MNTRKKPNVLNLNVQSPSLIARSQVDGALAGVAELKEFFTKCMTEMEDRISQRFGDLMADLANFRAEFKNIGDRVSLLEERLVAVNTVVANMQVRLNNIENDKILTDVIIHNIPADANINSVVMNILDKIGCNSIQPRNSFRITGNAAKVTHNKMKMNKSTPVIVKLATADDRVQLFKSLAAYRKNKNKKLSFNDVGLNGDNSISIFECLTSTNRVIMRTALKLKNDKKLFAVFSLRGQVYVRICENDKPAKITHIDDLKQWLAPN